MQSLNLALPPEDSLGRSPMSNFAHQLDKKLHLKHDDEEEKKYAVVRQFAHQVHQEHGVTLPSDKSILAVKKTFRGTSLAPDNFSPERDDHSQSTPSSPSSFKKIGRCLFGKGSIEGT